MGQSYNFFNGIIDAERDCVDFALLHKISELVDDIARSACIIYDVRENLAELFEIGFFCIEITLCGLCVAHDRCQRLIDLVRQRSCEGADGGDPGHMCKLFPELAPIFFGFFSFGDVMDSSGHTDGLACFITYYLSLFMNDSSRSIWEDDPMVYAVGLILYQSLIH